MLDKNEGTISAVEGGFALNDLQFILNSDNEENMYKVLVGTGTIRVAVFYVDARHEQDAVDRVVDFCEENEYEGLYTTFEELSEEFEEENEEGLYLDTFIENQGLISAGNSGLYIDLQGIEDITNG